MRNELNNCHMVRRWSVITSLWFTRVYILFTKGSIQNKYTNVSKFIVCRRFEPTYTAIYLFIFFSEPPPPRLLPLFWNYLLNEIPDKHKNQFMWQSYFFMFRKLQNKVSCFFINNTFIGDTRPKFDPKK